MSSDSDSDCYGGAAGLLCNLKSQFVSDLPTKDSHEEEDSHEVQGSNKVEKENTWEDIQQSFQIPEDILKKALPQKRGRKNAKKSETNEETPNETIGKRKTRNSQKNKGDEPVTPPAREAKTPQNRRKTTARSPRSQNILNIPQYPTYLIGEADGYTDHSAGMKLFQNVEASKDISQQNVDHISDSGSEAEEGALDESLINPVMSVKVHWRSKDFQKFFIRKFQKISSIFEHFSKTDDVKWENLYFDYNNQLLKPSDTPDSIGYNIGKFIEGGIVQQNVFELTKYTEGNIGLASKLDIKFQVANRKNPIFVKLGLKEKFIVAIIKLAEELGVPMTILKCIFDGDDVNPQSSPEDLEFEGGECIDVTVAG